MFSRSAAPSMMKGARSAQSCVRSARENAVCVSCSVGMRFAHAADRAIGQSGFFEQYVESRNIAVPFNQRRHASEARQRDVIEGPYVVAHARAMVVDAQGVA